MTDWVAASLEAQKQVLESALEAGEALTEAQQQALAATRAAAEANLAAMQAWMRLWGVGPW